jgi:hypothetical protein
MGEELVPIVLFISIAVAVIGGFYFRFRGRAAVQSTIRTALEQGQQLSPELLVELAGDQSPPRERDLKRGVILVALALALGLFGLFIDDPDATSVMQGAAMFPLLVGAAFLLLWFLIGRKA